MRSLSVKFLIASFLLLDQAAYADYDVKNLEANDSAGTSFVRDISTSSSGGLLTIRPFVIPDSASMTRPHRVVVSGMPAGLTALSTSASGSESCASLTVSTFQSNSFSYDFTGDVAENCVGMLAANYRTSGVAAGSYVFSATVTDSVNGVFSDGDDTSTSTNTLRLTIDPKANLTRARTLDADSDGFVDSLDLTFNIPPLSALPVGNLRVFADSKTASGFVFGWVSGSPSVSLTLSDGLLTGSETPRIEIDGNADYSTGSYFVGVLEDAAAPIVTPTFTGGTYTGAVTVALSRTETGSLTYSTGSVANSGSTAYSTGLVINSATSLSVFVSDLAQNSRIQTFNYAFVCAGSAPANGSISAYPACALSCNAGYALSGTSCVAIPSSSSSSGGGSSGGGSSSSSSSSSGGASTSSSSGWASTSSSSSSSGGASTGSVLPAPVIDPSATEPFTGRYRDANGLTGNSAEFPYFESLSGALSFLDGKISDPVLRKSYAAASQKLILPDSSYYFGFDKPLAVDYNRTLNAFVLYYVSWIQAKLKTATAQTQSDFQWADGILKGAYVWVPKVEERYVTKFAPYGIYRSTTFRTTFVPLKSPLGKLEKRYVGKFDKLRSYGAIDAATHAKAVNGWNRFVLHLSIYRKFGASAASKTRALEAIKAFDPVYKKRVPLFPLSGSDAGKAAAVPSLDTPVPIVVLPSSAAATVPDGQTVAQDFAYFETNLLYASQSDDVMRLQNLLKSEGYFGTLVPTGYFGPSTKASLSKFSLEKLKIENPNGLFSTSVRTATNEYLKNR